MSWRLVVADLNGTSLGEVRNAKQRKVRHAFNGRLKTCSTEVRLDNALADPLLSGAALIKAYDDQTLRFVGTLDTAEEVGSGDGSGGTVACTFADPFSVLADRLIGKSDAGYTDATAVSQKDKSVLVANILAAANADSYSGLDAGSVVNCGATSYAAYAPYKPAGEAITEIVNNLDGPDIEVVHQEPQAVTGGVRLALMNIVPAIGQARPGAVFEYATGRRNVASYRRAVTGRVANRVFGVAQGQPVVSASDASSIATYGLREVAVSSDLPGPLLQRLVDEHVRVRKTPRQIITFEPTRDDPAHPGRVPRYGVDYFLGDSVTFRAVQPSSGVVRVNAALRVYAIEWSIDEEGAAIPAITLTAD